MRALKAILNFILMFAAAVAYWLAIFACALWGMAREERERAEAAQISPDAGAPGAR